MGRPLKDVAEDCGVTYRQALHWAHAGHFRLSWEDRHGEPRQDGGSGHRAVLDWAAQRQLIEMSRLVHAGLLPALAAQVAEKFVAGARSVQVADGVAILRGDAIDADAAL